MASALIFFIKMQFYLLKNISFCIEKNMPRSNIIPTYDLDNLGNLISYIVIQRELNQPVSSLQRTLRDLRLVIFAIITNYYKEASEQFNEQFISEIEDYLLEVKEEIINEKLDEAYCSYVIKEVASTFKNAGGIKEANPTKQGSLLNRLILKSFDFKLQPFIKLIKGDFKRKSSSG